MLGLCAGECVAIACLASSHNLITALFVTVQEELVPKQPIHMLRKSLWVALLQPHHPVQNVLDVPLEQKSMPTCIQQSRLPCTCSSEVGVSIASTHSAIPQCAYTWPQMLLMTPPKRINLVPPPLIPWAQLAGASTP
jgi:hypothetical protein